MFKILLNENPLILCICQVCVESLLLFKPATRANDLSKQAAHSWPRKSPTRALYLLTDCRQSDVGSVSECHTGRVC